MADHIQIPTRIPWDPIPMHIPSYASTLDDGVTHSSAPIQLVYSRSHTLMCQLFTCI